MDGRSYAQSNRKASIKETGEEISQEDWARFDAAVAEIRAERAGRSVRREGYAWRSTPITGSAEDEGCPKG